jgi:NodT family efflux transporter outer membrane factor (OMF) lipoprotein
MKMNKLNLKSISSILILSIFSACTSPSIVQKTENKRLPESYSNSLDSTNTAKVKWQKYFTDPFLNSLIDSALKNNQELNITLQEIEIARNEVRAKKGEYIPSIGLGAGAAVDKTGRYTSRGASEANLDIKPGTPTPEPLPNYMLGAYANWEVDIWSKLRNAKKAAFNRYMSTANGKNFLVTNLIAEIANLYYELLSLDNQLIIINQNIDIQRNALEIVKLQKTAGRVTELAVRRFEAHVLNTRSMQFDIQQKIIETENRINFLIGRSPQTIERNTASFNDLVPSAIQAGVPAQLLDNRPDVKQAELALMAAKLDVKSAKARFYPSLGITAGIGFQAFDAGYLIKAPESLLYSLAGDITAPLVNRNAIKAAYLTANAKQIQAVYNYEQTILKAYIEVVNQLSNINNLNKTYDLKLQEVSALTQSVSISNDLFRSARADYLEVLLTQRDAIEAKFELIETKRKQMNAMVNIYRALGGGWN